MKKNVIPKLVVVLLGIVAVAGLAFNIFAYSQINQTILTVQHDDQVVDKMIEVANLKKLLLQLDSGDTNQTRQMLSLQLNGELSKMHVLKSGASIPVEETASLLASLVTKAEKGHAGYNLSMAQRTVH